MWSFDDEENKQSSMDETERELEEKEYGEGVDSHKEDKNDDDFDSRDPFSRGGDFYTSYNGDMNGNAPKKPNKKPFGSLIPALLICVVVFVGTIFFGYVMNDSYISLGGGSSVTTGATNATGTSGGTKATAPAITQSPSAGTPTVTYVQWDPAIVERCLNASVLVAVENVGSGSGVIYTTDGYIITNYHVVSNNDNRIMVTLYSGEKLYATYIYGDESNDIAVLKIDKNDCVAVEVSASPVNYMNPVMVIGNALGRGFNTTQGVVSAPASEVYFSSTKETMTLIRVDAAVNSGNSGGGLFNTEGQLIGIVNSKLSGTTSSGSAIENMGYAIPMSSVMKCINDLREYGYVTGVARLGLTVSSYLKLGNQSYSGVSIVKTLVSGGSAELAGMKIDDVLYRINGETISSFESLKKMITAYSVGDSVQITVLRPTESALKQTNPYAYLRECEEITLTLTFVEFNPNA
ncbi:MAG: trypsin-like peptidase domain-containing protein [Clostridia bacterium]|nr:trypsin-like peptidase domain-containing protein [Clostridia bacterium]